MTKWYQHKDSSGNIYYDDKPEVELDRRIFGWGAALLGLPLMNELFLYFVHNGVSLWIYASVYIVVGVILWFLIQLGLYCENFFSWKKIFIIAWSLGILIYNVLTDPDLRTVKKPDEIAISFFSWPTLIAIIYTLIVCGYSGSND